MKPSPDHAKPDPPKAGFVTIRPEIRDSDVERMRSIDVADTLCWKTNAIFPPEFPTTSPAVFIGLAGTIRRLASRDVTLVAIPEPLWVRYWPRTVVAVVTARLLRRVASRPALRVCTYAIENLDPKERLTHPQLDRWPLLNRAFAHTLLFGIRLTSGLVDRAAFGSEQAAVNYRQGRLLPRVWQDDASAVVWESLAPCNQCGPLAPLSARAQRVLFLGHLDVRKGVHDLLAAWEQSALPAAGWELVICGRGPLGDEVRRRADTGAGIRLLEPSRDEIHALLRDSRAVVLPSTRVPRWREQLGLPLLEGEAHGCALITSSESGLATELARRSAAAVVPAGDVVALARALDALPDAAPGTPQPYDGRAPVTRFFLDAQ